MTAKKETRGAGKGIKKLKKETLKDLEVKGKSKAVKGGRRAPQSETCTFDCH